jgi:hypothetical protein
MRAGAARMFLSPEHTPLGVRVRFREHLRRLPASSHQVGVHGMDLTGSKRGAG